MTEHTATFDPFFSILNKEALPQCTNNVDQYHFTLHHENVVANISKHEHFHSVESIKENLI